MEVFGESCNREDSMKKFLMVLILMAGCGKNSTPIPAPESLPTITVNGKLAMIISSKTTVTTIKKKKNHKSRHVVHQVKKGLFIGGEK